MDKSGLKGIDMETMRRKTPVLDAFNSRPTHDFETEKTKICTRCGEMTYEFIYNCPTPGCPGELVKTDVIAEAVLPHLTGGEVELPGSYCEHAGGKRPFWIEGRCR